MRRRSLAHATCLAVALTACYRASASSPAATAPEPYSVLRRLERPPDGMDFISARVLRAWSSQEGTIVELDRGDEHGVGVDWDSVLIDREGRPVDENNGRVVRLKSQRTLAAMPHAPKLVTQTGWVRLQRPPFSIATSPSPSPSPAPATMPPAHQPVRIVTRTIQRQIAGSDLLLTVGVGTSLGVHAAMKTQLLDANKHPLTSGSIAIVRVAAHASVLRVTGGAGLQADFVELVP